MKIVDINCGEYVTRPHWKNLVITRSATTFKLMYVSNQNSNKGEIKEVKENSSSHYYDDFIYTDAPKNFKNIKDTIKMDYDKINLIVINNKTQEVKCFETEEQAHEYIEDKLEISSRTKFTVFKPIYKIEPKVSLLKDLITYIKE